MSNGTSTADDPIVLHGAQRAIRDAYVDADTGLFTLNCVPGAGKSVVAQHLAAEDVLRRYQAGDPTPEQHVAIISFNRDEAAEIVPAVCDRLETIVDQDLVSAVSDISDGEVRYLKQRLRDAPAVGTIDGLLRSIFEDIAHELGFSEMPSVGNEALIAHVHRDCYERVATDPACTESLQALETAYPSDEHADSVAEMLKAALNYCRDRRLPTAAFRETLKATRDGCYPDGPPSEIHNLVSDSTQFGWGERTTNHLQAILDTDEQSQLVNADRDLYAAWTARIDDFCTVLSAYRGAYRDIVRERGVVTHTDVAFLVDTYFDDTTESVLPGAGWDVEPAHRDRIRERYRARLKSVIIDEAQDVSAVQHAALTHVITPATRVFACGDVRQGIYRWRHADPTVFDEATTSGTYLGVEWETHEHRTATTTYRCTPAIAAAVNTISEPMFDDGARGGLSNLATAYPPLDAARNEEAAGSVPIHLSAFRASGAPGSPQWVAPDDGAGEARSVATHVAKGLADGTFCTADGEPLSISVLFRRRRYMPAYEEAFTEAGLQVHTDAEPLFAAPAVEVVWAVADWLIEPESAARTKTLLTGSPLDISIPTDVLETHGWDVDDALATGETALDEASKQVLHALQTLRDQRDVVHHTPASVWVETIIETLGLRAGTDACDGDTDAPQRVANLDALVETIVQWEQDTQYTPQELTTLVDPLREDPSDGPKQPSTAHADADVTFRTVHEAKGDEDDVVVIADSGFDVWYGAPHTQRLFTHGTMAGLAPPPSEADPNNLLIPPFDSSLYDPAKPWEPDSGLRWGTARWRDSLCDTATRDELIGPSPITTAAAAERAEQWRLLYVAITRTRDHLVVPVPQSQRRGCQIRDRWVDTVREALQFTDGRSDSYTVTPPESDPNCDTVTVGVNDVDLFATRPQSDTTSPVSAVATSPPMRDALDDWVPRFVNPSTLYPLTEDPEAHVLAHLLGEPLHTATNAVPDTVPLQFDRLGPEEVGQCLHAVLTTLIERNVATESLESFEPVVRETFEHVVDERAPEISESERGGMYAFFQEILASIVETQLWTELTDPTTTVRVDQPIDGLVELNDVEIEIHGEADILIEYPDGDRHVADLKITLAPLSETSRRRYELQVAAYAYLLDQYQSISCHTHRTVETFGVERETITSSWPPEVVERRLSRLVDATSSS